MKTLVTILSLLACHPLAAQVNLSLDKADYQPGEAIVADWTGIVAPTATDWIGIYPAGITPGSQDSSIWQYTDGSASGSLTFATPGLGIGNWTAFLLANDGYTVLASDNFTIATPGGGRSLESFTLDKSTYRTGEDITADWSGLTQPNGTDWVGIYPRNLAGVPDGDPVSTAWFYVNNTRTATTGAESGSVTFSGINLPVGEWTAYFLLDDAYEFLATVEFEVLESPIIAFDADHVFIDDSPDFTLSWVLSDDNPTSLTISDGTTITDVLGLDVLDVNPTDTTTYTLTLNGSETASTTVYKYQASSSAFGLASDLVAIGSDLTVSWTGASAAADSLVAIYYIGEDPFLFPPLEWLYLNGTRTPGGSVPSGSLSFTLPAGDYYAILFTHDGGPVEQGPIRFSVGDFEASPIVITGLEVTDTEVAVSWSASPGMSYDVITSGDLVSWSPAVSGFVATGSEETLVFARAGDTLFVRIQAN